MAAELDVADRARFVEANLYDARHMLPEPESFDLVFTTWGTIGWLPDVAEWARIIPWFLKPGGRLFFEDDADDADPDAKLEHARTWEWMHPLGEVFGALRAAGLTVDEFTEHDEVLWQIFPVTVPTGDGMFGWPAERWLPLSYTISASAPRSSSATGS